MTCVGIRNATYKSTHRITLIIWPSRYQRWRKSTSHISNRAMRLDGFIGSSTNRWTNNCVTKFIRESNEQSISHTPSSFFEQWNRNSTIRKWMFINQRPLVTNRWFVVAFMQLSNRSTKIMVKIVYFDQQQRIFR